MRWYLLPCGSARSSVHVFRKQWLATTLIAMSALGWSVNAQALDAPPPDSTPMTLRAAITRTLAHNPELEVFGFSLRAQDARGRQAELRPAPTLNVALENIAGTGDFRGVDAVEATFSLAQVIELGGKRAARGAVAQSGRDAIIVARQAAQLDVLAEVTRRFIHVAADQEQIALTRTATELALQTVAAVEQRVDAAKSPEAELHRARILLARARVEQEHAEHELLTSRRKLAAQWGENRADFGTVTADLYAMPKPLAFATLVERLHANPDFVRFASEARLRDAEIRLAQTWRTPDVQISGGIRRLEGSDDQAVVLGISVPLFAGRHAEPAIAETQALRGRTDAERRAAEVRAEAQLFELHQELKHAITETVLLRDTVLPQMNEVLTQTRYAYERGRYGYLEWVAAQREFIDVQRSLIEAAANAHNYRTEIERLTAEPLADSN